MDEESLDEVRLAVGEACALAAVRNQGADSTSEILIELTDDGAQFAVTVHDQGGSTPAEVDDQLALALITALVPVSSVESDGAASTIKMSWPTTAN